MQDVIQWLPVAGVVGGVSICSYGAARACCSKRNDRWKAYPQMVVGVLLVVLSVASVAFLPEDQSFVGTVSVTDLLNYPWY